MAGELLAMRRAALGAPISEYAVAVDRARTNLGGKGPGNTSTGVLATSVSLLNVAASATPHTRGDFTELFSSTTFHAETITVTIWSSPGQSTVNSACLLTLATGAALSEADYVANIPLGGSVRPQSFTVPCNIPAGTRVAACLQGVVVSQGVNIVVTLRQAGDQYPAPTVITTIGADTATSNGLVMTVPSGAHTKSDWTQLTAATSQQYNRLLVCLAAPSTGTMTATTGMVDIATGGSGSESVLINNVPFEVTAAELFYQAAPVPYIVNIPVGTRLTARYSAASAATGARPTVVVIGFG